MLAVHSQKNANYLHILGVLRYLRDEKLISEAQYLLCLGCGFGRIQNTASKAE